MAITLTRAFILMITATLITSYSIGANSLESISEPLFKASTQSTALQQLGKQGFQQHCAHCHEGAIPKAPHRELLQTMPVTAILGAITDGIMREQAKSLTDKEKQAIAEYLSQTTLAAYQAPPPPPVCSSAAAQFDRSTPLAEVGWGYDNRRFVPPATAALNANDLPKLTLKWSLGFPQATRARSQPVVAMRAIFVGSQDGTIYALDLATGCARWTANIGAEIRTAIVVEPWQSNNTTAIPRLFFGDLLGRVYALDAITGKTLWRISASDHPSTTITGTPVLYKNSLLVPVSSLESATAANPDFACCTSQGSVIALNIADGSLIWRHRTIEQEASYQGLNQRGVAIYGPSGAAVWNSPTVDIQRGVLYHGSGQNYSKPADQNSDAVFAVDIKSGERQWHQQMTANDIWVPTCIIIPGSCQSTSKLDADIAASVLLIKGATAAQDILIAGQKSGWVYALDPNQAGKLLWKKQLGRGGLYGGIHFGMAAEDSRIYIPIADTPDQWDGKPSTEQGYPGVQAIDARTGTLLWRAIAPVTRCKNKHFCNAGVSAALTAIKGAVIAGHLDGMLRAYDGNTGKVLWETDTTQTVAGVNGITAQGGSISGPGAAVADGHLIINSGYGFGAHEPGNALLVYSVGHH